MTVRRWWAGYLGPFYYDDGDPIFKFETSGGTVEVDAGTLAGQLVSAVDFSGGEIDNVLIGQNTPEIGSFLTFDADYIILNGPTLQVDFLDCVASVPTLDATPTYWVQVLVNNNTTGYIPIYLETP